MFSWLKKHFIPHAGNDHRPHILHGTNIRNILVVVILLEIFSFLIPTLTHLNTSGGMAAVLPAVLADLTNTERQSQNLPALTVNTNLNKAALMKAEDMATLGYFAHTSPAGKTPWYWIEKVGYKYQYAGENLAINFTDSQDVTNAWMNSPTHKANIVKGNYTEVGTGVATGIFQGRETVFVAQVYANPLPKVETVQPVIKKEVKKLEESTKIAEVKETTNVLGAEVTINTTKNKNDIYLPVELPKPTIWQRLIASPRNTMNFVLFIAFGIIAIALLLYIFIKIKNHHQDLITNGLVAFAVIGAIFVVNNLLSHNNMVITDSFDYSIQDT